MSAYPNGQQWRDLAHKYLSEATQSTLEAVLETPEWYFPATRAKWVRREARAELVRRERALERA